MGYGWGGPSGGVDENGQEFVFQHPRCCFHKGEAPECLWHRKDGPCCPHCVAHYLSGADARGV